MSNTSVMVSPTPTPTASPSAAVAPTTPPTTAVPSTPPGVVGDLAQTGVQLWAILAALLALTAGGVLVFTSRRHQH